MFRCVLLHLLLLNHGLVSSSQWKGNYSSQNKCAVKGSNVLFTGKYKYPNPNSLETVFWLKNPVKYVEPDDLSVDPDYKDRVQQTYSKEQDLFTLLLKNVTQKDEATYCVRFRATQKAGNILGYPGIVLRVTDLTLVVPDGVVEGQSTNLSCSSTCELKKFIWYRNEERLSNSTELNVLVLPNVSRSDTGSYRCALQEEEHLKSPAVTLSVGYPPEKVSVKVSGSAGASVTLTCSSDSNPSVQNYSWFEENKASAVAYGRSFSFSSFSSSYSGRFYCEVQNAHGSQRSDVVLVSTKGGLAVLLLLIPAVVATAAAGVAVFLCVVKKIIRKKGETASGINSSQPEHTRPSVTDPMGSSVLYADVTVNTSVKPGYPESGGDEEEVQYGNIYHDQSKSLRHERNPHAAPQLCISPELVEDFSVIYSSIKRK